MHAPATDPGPSLLAAAIALRDELQAAAQANLRRVDAGGRPDALGVVRGRTSIEQACIDVHALLRCLDDELLRRHRFPGR